MHRRGLLGTLPGERSRFMTNSPEEFMSIAQKVTEIISQQLDVDVAEIKMEASFIDDLGADSLAIVELVLALEEEFQIEIPDEDTEKIQTVQDAISYIQENGT